MNRPRKKEALLAILFILLLLLIAFQVLGTDTYDPTPVEADLDDSDYEPYLAFLQQYKESQHPVVTSSRTVRFGTLPPRRNPFRRPTQTRGERNSEEARGLGHLSLQGILWHKTEPAAIIANRIVHPGDYIHGFVVRSIHREKVVLASADELRVLRLKSKRQRGIRVRK